MGVSLVAPVLLLGVVTGVAGGVAASGSNFAKILDAARKNRDTFVDARNKLQAGSDTTALDTQINQLNGQIAQLETQLASVNNSLNLTGLN